MRNYLALMSIAALATSFTACGSSSTPTGWSLVALDGDSSDISRVDGLIFWSNDVVLVDVVQSDLAAIVADPAVYLTKMQHIYDVNAVSTSDALLLIFNYLTTAAPSTYPEAGRDHPYTYDYYTISKNQRVHCSYSGDSTIDCNDSLTLTTVPHALGDPLSAVFTLTPPGGQTTSIHIDKTVGYALTY